MVVDEGRSLEGLCVNYLEQVICGDTSDHQIRVPLVVEVWHRRDEVPAVGLMVHVAESHGPCWEEVLQEKQLLSVLRDSDGL